MTPYERRESVKMKLANTHIFHGPVKSLQMRLEGLTPQRTAHVALPEETTVTSAPEDHLLLWPKYIQVHMPDPPHNYKQS